MKLVLLQHRYDGRVIQVFKTSQTSEMLDAVFTQDNYIMQLDDATCESTEALLPVVDECLEQRRYKQLKGGRLVDTYAAAMRLMPVVQP